MKTFKILSFLIASLFMLCILASCQNKVVFEVEETNIEIAVGETYLFEPKIENITAPRYDFSISESGIVKIVNRQITGLKPGVCEVTISLRDKPKVDSITLIITVVEDIE
ncbi:MAG: hypothetical protein J6K18_03385 [Bacilli bacterium]|nr:hypothetical protein [Bacilli bacterium]